MEDHRDRAAHAYLAGILDGEGTITIHCHMQHNRRKFQFKPRLIVGNTHKPLLDALQQQHGGVISVQSWRCGRKKFFIWRVFNADGIEKVLSAARPFLIVKAEAADIVLRFVRSRLESRRITKNARYSEEEVSMFLSVRELNRRQLRADSVSDERVLTYIREVEGLNSDPSIGEEEID